MKKTYEAIIRILFLLIVAAFFAGYASAAQWVKTDPADVNLTGVWTTYTTTTEIFCTGISGVIIHHDGTAWESMDSGAVVDLNAIWGTSATDIFAVGDNATILHYNGIAWSSQLSAGNNLNAVWGTPESNVYAVGNSGTILHYDGTTWSSMTSGTGLNLNGVWGSSATDVFAVGENLTILHYDGSVWTAFTPTSSTYVDLNAVWGYAADSVFAAGEAGTIAWYNGNVWTLVSSEITNVEFNAIWGASACNIYAAGSLLNDGIIYHFNGSEWSSQTVPAGTEPLLGIHGTSMRDIFAVGEQAGSVSTFLTYTVDLNQGEQYPKVCATSPVDGTLEISPDTGIYALFSTEMDPDTITTATFTLTTGNDTISGTVSYEAGGFAVFTPDDDLSYATTYVATISTDVEDPFGYGIGYDSDYTWDFTTTTILLDSDSKGCFISSAGAE